MCNDSVQRLSGNIVDVIRQEIYPGELTIRAGCIQALNKTSSSEGHYLLPGFVDAHVHVESSMLVPSEFSRLAVVHGCVATISDPHEIGNVLGMQGVDYMLRNASETPLKFYFGAPSCVPATSFESAGAEIGLAEVEQLLNRSEVHYLSEMMNFPGVLARDPVVLAKIALAVRMGKVVDGHAPGLRAEQAKQYAAAGISTDHECFTLAEAEDKISAGMKIIIREGSAARNFDALLELLDRCPDQVMLCSDDKHPNDLVAGHIDRLLARAVARKVAPLKAIRAASYNPVKHYGLSVGLLQLGDPADFVIVDNLIDFNVQATYISGKQVAVKGRTLLPRVHCEVLNNFICDPVRVDELCVPKGGERMRVIEALDGQLITKELLIRPSVEGNKVVSDTKSDVLKLVVVNRYTQAPPAIAFVKGFGLVHGALASSVAHDSHNIIAVGVDDESLASAINLVIDSRGGICAVGGQHKQLLPLPVAGLMSDRDGYQVAKDYESLDLAAKSLGATLNAPFMTLSFLALLVIPSLKLSDKGLFDGNRFRFVPLFESN